MGVLATEPMESPGAFAACFMAAEAKQLLCQAIAIVACVVWAGIVSGITLAVTGEAAGAESCSTRRRGVWAGNSGNGSVRVSGVYFAGGG